MSVDRTELDTAAVWQAVREVLPLVAGWLLVVAGAVVLGVGWFGISGEALVAKQLPYLVSGGLGGLGLVVVGAAVIASRDLRGVGGRLGTLERQVADLHAALLHERRAGGHVDDAAEDTTAVTERTASTGDAGGDEVLVLPQGERYHRPGCPIVAGKDGVEALARSAADEHGYVACKVCDAGTVRA